MRRSTKKKVQQDWSIGKTVRVGFLQLVVVGYRDGGYTELCSSKTGVRYLFKAHQGLTRLGS